MDEVDPASAHGRYCFSGKPKYVKTFVTDRAKSVKGFNGFHHPGGGTRKKTRKARNCPPRFGPAGLGRTAVIQLPTRIGQQSAPTRLRRLLDLNAVACRHSLADVVHKGDR